MSKNEKVKKIIAIADKKQVDGYLEDSKELSNMALILNPNNIQALEIRARSYYSLGLENNANDDYALIKELKDLQKS